VSGALKVDGKEWRATLTRAGDRLDAIWVAARKPDEFRHLHEYHDSQEAAVRSADGLKDRGYVNVEVLPEVVEGCVWIVHAGVSLAMAREDRARRWRRWRGTGHPAA
jgi:hypothetical protein